MKPVFSLLFACGIVLIVLNWPQLLLKLTPTPDIISESLETYKSERAVFLYGGDLCTSCKSRDILMRLSENSTLLLVFEEELSDGEIQNFMQFFKIPGIPVRGDHQVETYLQRLYATFGDQSWRRNYVINFDGRKKIRSFEDF